MVCTSSLAGCLWGHPCPQSIPPSCTLSLLGDGFGEPRPFALRHEAAFPQHALRHVLNPQFEAGFGVVFPHPYLPSFAKGPQAKRPAPFVALQQVFTPPPGAYSGFTMPCHV